MLNHDAVPWLKTDDGIYVLQYKLSEYDEWQDVPAPEL